MASVNDIGTPLETMDDPPLTAWQAAVRDVVNGSDVPVDDRFLPLVGGTIEGTLTIRQTLTVDGTVNMNTGLNMNGQLVYYVAEPTISHHAATKNYVDTRIWFGTQLEYDAIQPKLENVLYVVTG